MGILGKRPDHLGAGHLMFGVRQAQVFKDRLQGERFAFPDALDEQVVEDSAMDQRETRRQFALGASGIKASNRCGSAMVALA